MDITVNLRTILILFLANLLFSSCKVNKENTSSENDWIFAYKAQACTSCLKNLGVQIPKDNSEWLRFEVINERYLRHADSIGLNYTNIVNDRARYFKGADMDGGKAITNGCLMFFNSPQLDSIAKSEHAKALND